MEKIVLDELINKRNDTNEKLTKLVDFINSVRFQKIVKDTDERGKIMKEADDLYRLLYSLNGTISLLREEENSQVA